MAKEGEWEREGELAADIIADIAEISEDIAVDVRKFLSDLHGYQAVRDGEDDPYATDARYSPQTPDTYNFRDMWESFSQNIRFRSRFFSEYAQTDLDNIFGDLGAQATWGGIPVIRNISPQDADRFLYRGRLATSWAEVQKILSKPNDELGPPPPRQAKAGRMNAAGISVFYGAFDSDTCVAEVRAPVGAWVVMGQFELIRSVSLLNLDALANIRAQGSYFESTYRDALARSSFLGSLVDEIARPVLPGDETHHYLPTQVVAEYLASRAKLDGMIFHSSQTGRTGKNIVLFNHASGNVKYDLAPGTTTTFFPFEPDDDYGGLISVFEETPKPKPPPEPNDDPFGIGTVLPPDLDYPSSDETWLSTRVPTIQLVTNSVRVLDIEAVSYATKERRVMWHRLTSQQTSPSDPK